MAAPTSFPSWAYSSAGQPAVIVQNLAAFSALPGPGTWSSTPFPVPPPLPLPPFDPGFLVTDSRAQQQLVEARITNYMLGQALGIADDVITVLRPDVLANDSSLST